MMRDTVRGSIAESTQEALQYGVIFRVASRGTPHQAEITDLLCRELVANDGIDIIPVVSNSGIAELDRQKGHISHTASLRHSVQPGRTVKFLRLSPRREPSHANDAVAHAVVISFPQELLKPAVVLGNGEVQQGHQSLRIVVAVPCPDSMLVSGIPFGPSVFPHAWLQ